MRLEVCFLGGLIYTNGTYHMWDRCILELLLDGGITTVTMYAFPENDFEDIQCKYTLASGGPYCDCGYKKIGEKQILTETEKKQIKKKTIKTLKGKRAFKAEIDRRVSFRIIEWEDI